VNRPPTPLESPRFDWMQATVREDPQEIWEVLSGTLGAEVSDTARGLNGYEKSRVLTRNGESLARVLYGGQNGWPNVVASGAPTDDFVPVLRAAYPCHVVTRMDSAQDFDGEGGYDALQALMLALSDATGITRNVQESVRNGVRSRTTYLGAPSSRIRVRAYEKGRMEQQEGRSAPDHWVRLEAQIRPTGDARAASAGVGPVEAWGSARWLRRLASEAMGLEVPPITMQLRRDPDYERALRHLVKQYGATLTRAMEVEGSWDAVRLLLVAQGMGE